MNGEPSWRGSVGDYRFGAITGLILTGQRSRFYFRLPIANCRLPIDHWVITLDIQAVKDQRQIGNWKSAVENDLVPAEGFEPTLSSF
jgi:hypothetical protein